MKNKKNLIFIITILMTISVFSIGSFASWFTSKDQVENEFNIGSYDIVTHEEFTPEGHSIGENITKEVTVQNTGTLPAYVRVKIVPFWKNGMPLKCNGVDTVSLNFSNSSEWFNIGDFYYYKKILQPGEKSEPLLDGLVVNSELKDNSDYKIENLVVDVFTESFIYEGDMKEDTNSTNIDENNNGEVETSEERHDYIHNDIYNEDNMNNIKKYFGLDENNIDRIRELPGSKEEKTND